MISEMTLEQLVERRNSLSAELAEATIERLNEIEQELTEIEARELQLKDSIEKRKQLENKVMTSGNVIRNFRTEGKTMEERNYTLDSLEYRSSFLKKIRNIDLDEIETRAFSTVAGSAQAAIPTTTLNKVLEQVQLQAPMLAEIELFKVPGGISVPVEDVVNAATKHAENATITAAEDKLIPVSLQGYEVTKLLKISKSVMKMSVDAFEEWLVKNLSKSIASFIIKSIFYGTGTGEAKGIDKIAWTPTNSVTVAKDSNLTATNVTDLIAALPGGYDGNAKFNMSKKTLFKAFMPLKDASKNDLVTREGNSYFIYGYPVLLDETITLNEAFLGDFSQYYANMPEEVTITPGFDLDSNSYKFLGCAMFDGKPGLESAFVKLVKSTT